MYMRETDDCRHTEGIECYMHETDDCRPTDGIECMCETDDCRPTEGIECLWVKQTIADLPKE